jgi:hypothetical protein
MSEIGQGPPLRELGRVFVGKIGKKKTPDLY